MGIQLITLISKNPRCTSKKTVQQSKVVEYGLYTSKIGGFNQLKPWLKLELKEQMSSVQNTPFESF
jgi:hypothetical protein